MREPRGSVWQKEQATAPRWAVSRQDKKETLPDKAGQVQVRRATQLRARAPRHSRFATRGDPKGSGRDPRRGALGFAS